PTADGGDQSVSTGNGNFFVRQGANNEEAYFNFSKGQRIDRRELFDNEFIVLDTIARLAWKLADETKVLLGHTVRKATAQRIGQRMSISMENGQMKRTPVTDTSSIVAWYTTDIPVSVGPEDFQGQLPGLVLEVDVNSGRRVYRAVEISPKVAGTIKEPKGGKRVTPAEFRKESDRLMEEMRANLPPGANIRIQQ
ncbi:MAG: GLPGLI family protein, partial [Chitinophagaceae bacterium]